MGDANPNTHPFFLSQQKKRHRSESALSEADEIVQSTLKTPTRGQLSSTSKTPTERGQTSVTQTSAKLNTPINILSRTQAQVPVPEVRVNAIGDEEPRNPVMVNATVDKNVDKNVNNVQRQNHLPVPTGDITDEEMEYLIRDIDNASTETMVHKNRWENRERENLAFKLDKLNDKKCRFVSHENYLKKCLDNNLVPNGLRVFVEPSIGNRNDDFLAKWHAKLEDFSKTLTNMVVDFCGTEVANTNIEISETTKRRKN